MSLILEILEDLWRTERSYKGARVNLFGVPRIGGHSYGSVKNTFWNMRQKGLVDKCDKGWQVTRAGKEYMRAKANALALINFKFKFSKDAPRNLIVMYDIPENQKAEREWFRWHLKKFNYQMIQRSVWVGPSPLPKQFLEYLEKIKHLEEYSLEY